jgi:hypothetical protein
MVWGLNPLAVSRFTNNPNSTARPKISMGKERCWRRDSIWQESNLHLLRFPSSALSQLSYPLLVWRITNNQRPIEIGVTNRICTGTNAFTGRDAAVTS